MLGYTRMRNGLCAICRWSKNSEVNRRGRDKKIPLGGSMGGDPSASLAAPLTQGSQGLRIATGAEGPRNDNIRKEQKKDGLPEQSIFCVVLQEITSWCSAG